MSFPEFKFNEIILEEWEDSTLKNYLEPAKFLFVIFKENDAGEYNFERIKFWNIPVEDLEEIERVWHRTVDIIRRGVNLVPKGERITNDLPKSTESRVAHVRPHTRNRAYRFDDVSIGDLCHAFELPDGRWMTKQCFWFNREYVKSIVSSLTPF